jgi:hypothetical protein
MPAGVAVDEGADACLVVAIAARGLLRQINRQAVESR